LRTTFRWKADDLDEAALRRTVGSSSLTLGGLLKHLALVEARSSTARLDGAPLPDYWTREWKGEGWEFTSAAEDSAEQLYLLWDDEVEQSRRRFDAALAAGGPEQLVHIEWPDGRRASLRRLLCDLIEEYGRHVGHADLLREAIDGRVGEDPPPGWQPVTRR
jgi:hypothetical protein